MGVCVIVFKGNRFFLARLDGKPLVKKVPKHLNIFPSKKVLMWMYSSHSLCLCLCHINFWQVHITALSCNTWPLWRLYLLCAAVSTLLWALARSCMYR